MKSLSLIFISIVLLNAKLVFAAQYYTTFDAVLLPESTLEVLADGATPGDDGWYDAKAERAERIEAYRQNILEIQHALKGEQTEILQDSAQIVISGTASLALYRLGEQLLVQTMFSSSPRFTSQAKIVLNLIAVATYAARGGALVFTGKMVYDSAEAIKLNRELNQLLKELEFLQEVDAELNAME